MTTNQIQNEEPLISLHNIGIDYNIHRSIFRRKTITVLDDVSFSINKGETLGVIGRNGHGKSTLLKVIANIISPNRGKIINKHNVKASLLTLNSGFIFELTGRNNIYLAGLALGMTKKTIDRNIDAIIEFTELAEKIDYPVRTYSTGMRSRLGFVISYIFNPDILLIDETLGVGDQNFRQKSTAAMQEKINSEQTVVLVSHSLDVIKRLCDRVLWIENGKVINLGDTTTIIADYQATF